MMTVETRFSTERDDQYSNDMPIYYVGFVGDHGSGKTTFADNLQKVLEETDLVQVLRFNMADALRFVVNNVLPTQLDTAVKRHPLERGTLQHIGEAWRLADKNHWVTFFLTAVQQKVWALEGQLEKPIVVLVSDTYNLNELPLMNAVVMINPIFGATTGQLMQELTLREEQAPHGYLAETIRGTQYALHNPAVVADMIDGPVVAILGDSPAYTGCESNILYAATAVLQDLANTVELLGLPRMSIPFELYHTEERWVTYGVTSGFNVVSTLPALPEGPTAVPHLMVSA
jgi:hypothetical protein